MKINYILILCITLTVTTSNAQFQSNGLSVSKYDLESNHYEADSTANALVIYEYGNSYIHEDTYKLITEIKKKVKIFNKDGFDHSTVEVYLYQGKKQKEKIKKIKAITYNLVDGKFKSDKLDGKKVFTEDYNENYQVVKFTLPNIQEGSVITYSYTIESPFIYNYYGWKFQEDIPKIYSEYNTSIPANYDYYIKLVGALKLHTQDRTLKRRCLEGPMGSSADCTIAKYAMKDIPAFIEEDYMTTKKNFISRIEYELNTVKQFDGSVDKIAKSWKDADHELKTMISVGKQLNKKTSLKGLISAIEVDAHNKLNYAKDIYKLIQDRFTWNKETKLFKDVKVNTLEKELSGNSAEINILLHNALLEQGFEVKPVLLSTRENGIPTKLFPVISEFNYLIVKLDLNGKSYFLDATDKYLNFGQLPFKCLNDYGRLLDFKKGSYWIDIFPDQTSLKQYRVVININDENQLQGELKSRNTGYHALSKKKSYYSNQDGYLDDLKNSQQNVEIIEHEIISDGFTDTKFEESIHFTFNEENMIDDKIYFNPFIAKFFTENPFKHKHRNYPINFGYKDSYQYSLEFSLDDKYEVVDMPRNTLKKLPNNAGMVSLSTKIDDNKLILFFRIDFKESTYNSNYYSYLKNLMAEIVDIQNNSIVVIKKNSI